MPVKLVNHGAIRYDPEEDEFLLKCSVCFEFWPLDKEFWEVSSGVQRCKACRQEAKNKAVRRHRKRKGTIDTPQAAGKRAAAKRYYDDNAPRIRKQKLDQYHVQRRAMLLLQD